MTADQREAYEERAGILEFDAGMTREEAERGYGNGFERRKRYSCDCMHCG